MGPMMLGCEQDLNPQALALALSLLSCTILHGPLKWGHFSMIQG